MPFPYSGQWSFDDSDTSDVTATRVDDAGAGICRFATGETDNGQVNFVDYRQMAALANHPAPYRGSKCIKVSPDTGADSFIQTTVAQFAAGALTEFMNLRLMVYFSSNLGDGADAADEFAFLSVRSAATGQMKAYFVNAAAGFQIKIEGGGGDDQTTTVERGKWINLEIQLVPAAAAAGVADWWVDGAAQTQKTGMSNLATTEIRLGFNNATWTNATPSEYMLIDQFAVNNNTVSTRVHQLETRFQETVSLYTSQHLFVGPGWLDDLQLVSGQSATTEDSVKAYDVVDAINISEDNLKASLRNTAEWEIVNVAQCPIYFKHGCYIEVDGAMTETDGATAGSGPYAVAKLWKAKGWGSDGAVRSVAGIG